MRAHARTHTHTHTHTHSLSLSLSLSLWIWEMQTSQAPTLTSCMCACMFSCFSPIWLFPALWTVAHQAPLYMGFSRQEYWSGLPCPFSGDLWDPGIKPTFPEFQVESLLLSYRGSPDLLHKNLHFIKIPGDSQVRTCSTVLGYFFPGKWRSK